MPGVRVIGLESKGEQAVGRGEPADFESDVAAMVAAVEAEHARGPFDVLHAQYGYPNGLAAMEASRRTGVPNLVSIQGGDGHWVGTCCSTHRDAIRAVLGHAGALLIGSASFAEEVRGHPRDARRSVHDHPREPPTPSGSGPATSRTLEPSAIRPRCSTTAGSTPARASWNCSTPSPMLVEGGRDLRLILSGIGPDVAAVGDRVEWLGLGDRVELAGYSSYAEAPCVYRRGDLFVSPTYSEGFSNTILEAMASGLPVVSTRAVGVVDCLVDGRNGLLVEPRDVRGLADAIARMLDDGGLRRDLSRNALHDVRTLYSWPAVTRAIVRVYEEVAARPVDNTWACPCNPGMATVASSDLSCRFRAEPHLL